MPRIFKPNDLQLILLTTAAQRENGNLLPPSETLSGHDERVRKVIPALIKHGLVMEAPVDTNAASVRQEAEAYIGLVITAAGRAAIGVDDGVSPDAASLADGTDDMSSPSEEVALIAVSLRTSKIGYVIELLRRPGGGSLAELTAATGWLPHTVRAALTGLRKKGHAIERGSRDGVTIYTLAS
ncbi:DUF3489 domain-containing protein [Sphingomonas montana]|uniref:DUF3489 domain-containing protein n=1 Tax=Sphingomonas montana TaxID=1843236 RepID=UPI00096F33EF|nr:DUF3489 domain-containing protein [Sphingomonas montana]